VGVILTVEQKHDDIEKYRAPALEKGLDIVELLSRTYEPLSVNQICEALQRSKPELYRMLQVLESRNYIERITGSEGYVITRKLLTLGTERQPLKDLLEFSAPLMRKLSERTGQGVHISVETGDQIVVIARSEAVGKVGYSVRVGYRKPLVQTASGRVLFAFQLPEIKESWMSQLRGGMTDQEVDKFLNETRKIFHRGFDQSRSTFVKGVTDLSVPIMENKSPIAALTIPYIEQSFAVMTEDEVLQQLLGVAELISSAIKLGYIKSL
jgi:DNA-binding IclR family transcriptional regulator